MFFIWNMIKADRYNEEANRINVKSLNKLGDAQRLQAEQAEQLQQSLEKLANRKRGVISSSIKDFISIYEKIMTIDFVESDGIRELSLGKFSPEVIGNMKKMVLTAGLALPNTQNIFTFVVGGGFTGAIAKEAELRVAAAQMRKKQVNAMLSQTETIKVVMDAIYKRAERMSMLLTKLNILFRKSLEQTREIVLEKGSNRANYSPKDREYIRVCFAMASTIKIILDAPLLDQEGELTEKSLEVIQIGENYIQEINTAVNS